MQLSASVPTRAVAVLNSKTDVQIEYFVYCRRLFRICRRCICGRLPH
jgi:hypothetical protein